MAEYLHMRRLNIKERRRTINSHFFIAFYYAVFFYDKGSAAQRHEIILYFLFFSIAALIFQLVTGTSRIWQKLAGVFLLIAYSAAFLGAQREFPGLEPHIARVFSMGFWWAAVALFSLDWILDHFLGTVPVTTSGGALVEFPKITGPHLPADDANAFLFARLRAEADAENSPLTALQLQFLDYSRIASDEDAKAVEEELYKQEHYWTFKKHIISLLALAIQKDRKENPKALQEYRHLLHDLKKGKRDQQLASLVEKAILKARADGEKFQDYFLYIVIGIAVVGLLLFALASLH